MPRPTSIYVFLFFSVISYLLVLLINELLVSVFVLFTSSVLGFFFYVFGAVDQTQVRTHAKLMLYHLL
jgi:hypothetical protein